MKGEDNFIFYPTVLLNISNFKLNFVIESDFQKKSKNKRCWLKFVFQFITVFDIFQ